MKITSRVFGKVEISDDRILTFKKGIIGYPQLKKFALLYDEEKGRETIQWLQSCDEESFAMPVLDPLFVKEDYCPVVDTAILEDLQLREMDDALVLVTVTVPKNLEEMTVNLKGPLIINVEKRKGCQVILEEESYPVKYKIYDILKKNRQKEKV